MEELSKTTLKVLTDITGETDIGTAINSTLKDALEHRMELVEKGMKNFEKKYGMNFSEFKKKWHEGKIKNKFSYNVEKEYIEWETLDTRKKRLKEASRWLE
ncbi:MAG: hypothetical protein AABX14_03770 [Candidatus Aenigmatarchaeota archaeon]